MGSRATAVLLVVLLGLACSGGGKPVPSDPIAITLGRDGSYDIYTVNPDGSGLTRLTTGPSNEYLPVWSPDGSKLAYVATLGPDIDTGSGAEIVVMNRDGSGLRQVTKLGSANFAPSWHPDGKRLIFASNHQDPKGRDFDIYMINVDGTGLERITFNDTFDGFPMFSPDGKKVVFASNRNAKTEGETNVFIADWVQ